ncbi:ATP-binding cassette domain-containing protein [Lapidilactobacillus bayanensis]|uniref:ATP-binding cassette domain-containing protein n=1 Tax=Lapidilactobacillus bayanensis TaxID=2485998 RepID=UPI000F776B1D|nr:ABC transporter ATP-binding protein [Lapidilactobacillus bayanensis]
MQKYFKIVKDNLLLSTLYCVMGVLIALFNTLNVHYFQQVLDHLKLLFLSQPLVYIYLGTLVILPIIGYLDEYAKNKLPERIYYGIKERTLTKLDTIQAQKIMTSSLGTLLQMIENGANAGRNVVFDFYFEIIRSIIPTILFSLIFIGTISTKLIWFIVLGYTIVFVVTHFLLRWLYAIKSKLLDNQESINRILTHGVMSFLVYRITGQYKSQIRKFHQLTESAATQKTAIALVHEAFFAIFALLVNLIKGLVIVLVLTDHLQSLSVGQIVALLLYIDNIYNPIAIFNVIYVQAKLDDVAYSKLNDFFRVADDPGMLSAIPVKSPLAAITFTNVSYTLGSRVLFANVNLQMLRGQIYYLVGNNGSGKSTLVNILLGLIKNYDGQIKFDHQPADAISLRSLYSRTSFLSQTAPVFAGTLRENIDVQHRLSNAEMMTILENVALIDDVQQLPDGLETKVIESGENLSGGQRQKLAFARLLAEANYSELVIMDEATSALDTASRFKILSHVWPALENKIVMIVTHRMELIPKGSVLLTIRNQQVHTARKG